MSRSLKARLDRVESVLRQRQEMQRERVPSDSSRWSVPTRIEAHEVRITNGSKTRHPYGTDIFEIATGAKFIDVYRAVVVMDGEVHEVTRESALPRDYEGLALLERVDRRHPRSCEGWDI